MADPISDEAYLEQHPEHRELDPAIRAQLRQNAQLTADLESERATRTQLERKAVFGDAGLPDVPERELFMESYKGDMTVEAIKEAAAKYPTLTSTAATTTAPDNRADLDAIRRVQTASAGAVPDAPMDFGDALDRAQSKEEWAAIMANAPAEAGIATPRTVQGSRLI